MCPRITACATAMLAPLMVNAVGQAEPSGDLIRISAPSVALEHVQLIDGTGALPRIDQTILISDGKIAAIGEAHSAVIPAKAEHLDLTGYSALPGLVGMHDHLFYSVDFFEPQGVLAHDMPFSFPRLYLAAGVTTIRTTGSFEPYTDLEIKKSIDAGTMIGPKMNVTGPYLEGAAFPLIQIHKLNGPKDAQRTVDYWAAEGAGSFKVYTDVSRTELKAAIVAAHRHGLTITGHLCSIGFREAAEMGIDGLEHGLFVDTEFSPDKKEDSCPPQANATAADLDISSAVIQGTIRSLIDHHVAVTSTLPAWEEFIATRRELPTRVLRSLSSDALRALLAPKERIVHEGQRYQQMLRKEMQFERAFVEAGGLLLAGCDGVLGADIAGFGDQRELEMLVEAGFTPLEAIKIASLNGARFLGQSDRIGSLEVGKQADIVLVRGDPSTNIADIENVELVFKDGVGYDSGKLIESVAGQVGIR
jgi:imidazolonepropionase-like amidohydrolase